MRILEKKSERAGLSVSEAPRNSFARRNRAETVPPIRMCSQAGEINPSPNRRIVQEAELVVVAGVQSLDILGFVCVEPDTHDQ